MTTNANTGGVQVTAKVAPLLIVVVVATVVALASYPARAATPEEDFAARCAAPGVVLCNGLDQASDISLDTAADGTIQGSIDTSTKASGAGSLKFTLRKGVADKNIGGAFDGPLGHTFGAGEIIHVQWRQMISPSYLTNNLTAWRSSIKQINIHGPTSTCQGAEFTTVTSNNTPMTFNWPSMYTNCGIGFNTDAGNNILCDVAGCPTNPGPLLQQGSSLTPSPNGNGYNCNYQNQIPGLGNGSGCFYPSPNVWYTYYEVINLGKGVNTNTLSVDAYVALNGGPYKQFQRASGITWAGGDPNFTRARLETYMTQINGGAPVDAFVWYDELIVSTQAIAAPGVGPLPIPQNLRLTP